MSLQAHEREGCPIKVQLSGQADGLERYIRAVERVGAVPVRESVPAQTLAVTRWCCAAGEIWTRLLFGQENHGSHPPDRERDRAELALAEAFLTWERPVLGICRVCRCSTYFWAVP